MKKLRKFVLNQNHQLTVSEMSQLSGGGRLPFVCTKEGEACAVYDGDGVWEGTCKKVSFPGAGSNQLLCIAPDMTSKISL